ncbi:hypothetical protein AVEN_169947-1 [Araneus ventricosus]|uniref:Uncharacterized protein n=1 Tax=Araneus ventricosus TaxID=182803 RepID=A0A4Y2JCT0_ARAVE|nr:hypothetical protein AVEN_169947-1 [Araneus ventricosus]
MVVIDNADCEPKTTQIQQFCLQQKLTEIFIAELRVQVAKSCMTKSASLHKLATSVAPRSPVTNSSERLFTLIQISKTSTKRLKHRNSHPRFEAEPYSTG